MKRPGFYWHHQRNQKLVKKNIYIKIKESRNERMDRFLMGAIF